MSELKGKFTEAENNDDRGLQLAINSIDYTVVPDRLSINWSNAKGIYLYGKDNNYARKIVNSADRCSSLVAVRNVQAEFIAGNGFEGATAQDVMNDTAIIINRNGDTAYNLLKFFAEQKSNINVAIHVNYNMLGEAVEFNMINYDFVRRKIKQKDEKYTKYIITNIWHLENDYNNNIYSSVIMDFNLWMEGKKKELNFTALECFEYNPDPLVVREQIEISGGIENYSGQLFYSKNTKDIYQKAVYDSLADKFQFLAECDLSSLSNIQNGYAGSGVLKYFSASDGEAEIKAIKRKTEGLKGSVNTGRFIVIPIKPTADMKMPTNVFESTEVQNRDKLYVEQKKEAKEGIQELYGTPNSILGNDTEGNFATQNMQQAFDFYNTRTQPKRTEVEMELTTLFKNSIFKDKVKLPIKIEPLKYISFTTSDVDISENDAIRAESQARLKGTVGGVQGILAIQQSVSQGTTQYEAGVEILIDIYGYTDEKARKILGEPIEQFPEDAKKVDEKTNSDENTNNE